MNKGKRKLVIEYRGNKITTNDLEKEVYQKLKEHGVKYSDSIEMYFSVEENIVYAVVANNTYKVSLNE